MLGCGGAGVGIPPPALTRACVAARACTWVHARMLSFALAPAPPGPRAWRLGGFRGGGESPAWMAHVPPPARPPRSSWRSYTCTW